MSNEAVYHNAPKTEAYDQTAAAPKTEDYDQTAAAPVKVEPETVEKKSRGLFDFLGKKKDPEENKYEETPVSSDYEQKVDVSESEEYRQTTVPKTEEYGQTTAPVKVEQETVDKKDHGLFDSFLGKKKEEENKYEETRISSDYEQKVDVSEPEPKYEEYGQTAAPVKVESETVEKEDRGLFDNFLGKKKEEENKKHETPISSDYEQKVDVSESEPKSEEQPETLFQKMHISHSGSSLSDEETLTEQLQEKIEERKERKEEEEAKYEDDNRVPIEKYEEEEVAAVPPPSYTDAGVHTPTDVVHHETPEPEEKKGFMEKLKEKLPRGHKKPVEEQVVAPPPPTVVAAAHEPEVEHPEKKGILDKIKDKIPGLHSKTEEEKEKEKEKVKSDY